MRLRIGTLCILSFLVTTAVAQKLTPSSRAAAQREVEFDVFLPMQHADQLDQLLIAQQTPASPSYRQWLTPEQFFVRFGPKAEDIATVTNALGAAGLVVTGAHSHGVHVRGTVEGVQTAFGVALWNANTGTGTEKLMATQPLSMPVELSQLGAHVTNFSTVIPHHIHARRVETAPENRKSAAGGYWFDDIKQAYGFPSYRALNGKGSTIGIVMSSDYLKTDIDAYFGHENLASPKIVRQPVLGGAAFNANSDASFEAELDIEQAGGMAPGATIILCNVPDLSDQSVIAGYLTLVENNQVDVVSSSFGEAEALYSAGYNSGTDFSYILNLYDEIYKQGNAQGITFVASSGDSGGLGLPSLSYFTTPTQNPPVVAGKFLPGIETPASSPFVTAVGGTNLVTTYDPPSLESKYVAENADGDPELPYDPYGVGNLASGGYWGSGGGASIFFKKPVYQTYVRTGSRTRTVPDVSLEMGGCPASISVLPCGPDRSYVYEVFGGHTYGVIGTSVSAPEFAGLLALEVENLNSRLGNANYLIYAQAATQSPALPYFREGIPGFNGYEHTTASGYNMVLGNGTVHARNFIFAPFVAPAGNPQTPSNP